MTSETHVWRVGFIGISPVGLFLIERLSLEKNVRIVGVFDRDPARCALASEFGCQVWQRPESAIADGETDIIFFTGRFSEDDIVAVLARHKHVVIDQAWRLSSVALRRLAEVAKRSRRVATTVCLRRWSAEFALVPAVKKTGRLGALRSLRAASFEKCLPNHSVDNGVLREFGYHWLDQLLLLAEASPSSMFARQFCERGSTIDHGFLATFEFANGCTAQIELQSRSRLGFRTGWMLEGAGGSFRNDKIYTETDDGEIVDEVLPPPPLSDSPFIGELVSACRGESSSLPTLDDAAFVVRLIEAVERSASSGEVVRL